MYQNELCVPRECPEFCNDVGLATAPFDDVSEDLLVEVFDAPEVESLLDIGIEEIQEFLEERFEEILEALVMPDSPSPCFEEDEKATRDPPRSKSIDGIDVVF